MHLPILGLVFRSVVNESLLSALEVRPLNRADISKLEQARGLLLRKLFGREGYGAVAGSSEHKSVTLASLRQRSNIATIASELTVRRLMWFHSALAAEEQGQVRLELAAMFGSSDALTDGVPADGLVTSQAPRILHLLFLDMQKLNPGFVGFSGNWKAEFLAIPSHRIKALRLLCTPESEPAKEQPAVEVAAELRCEICGEGPWHNQRALRARKTKKHRVRHEVQTKTCPLCSRQFTTKTAAQRHFSKKSCGKPVNNHGHAGALAGQRQTEAALQAQDQCPPPPSVQLTLRSFFLPSHARIGVLAANQPFDPSSEASSSRTRAAEWQPARSSAAGPGAERANAEDVHVSVRARPGNQRHGGMVHANMDHGRPRGTGSRVARTNGPMEGATSSSWTATPAGTSSSHHCSSPGEVAPSRPSSSRSDAELCQAPRCRDQNPRFASQRELGLCEDREGRPLASQASTTDHCAS